MKKSLSTLLVILLLFLIVGCDTSPQAANSPVEAYKNAAQKYIDSGDFDSAIKVLEEGIINTNDSQLQQMLTEVKKQQATQQETVYTEQQANSSSEQMQHGESEPQQTDPTEHLQAAEPNYKNYAGSWGNGSIILNISGDTFTFFAETGYSDRRASIEESFTVRAIKNNTAVFSYIDSWGNTGTCELTFADDHIVMTIKDVIEDPYAMCGFSECTEIYYRDSVENGDYSDTQTEAQPYDSIIGCYYCIDIRDVDWIMLLKYDSKSKSLIAENPVPWENFAVNLTQDDENLFSGTYGEEDDPDFIIYLEVKENGDISICAEDFYYNEKFYYEYKPL